MSKFNLFWTIIWSIVFCLALLGIFWNPAQFFLAVIAAIFCGLCLYGYIKGKKAEKAEKAATKAETE